MVEVRCSWLAQERKQPCRVVMQERRYSVPNVGRGQSGELEKVDPADAAQLRQFRQWHDGWDRYQLLG